MTEDEAKTKWCPYARRPSKTNWSDRTCIASACMVWRKTDNAPKPALIDARNRADWERGGWFTDGVLDANGNILMRLVTLDDGYCGLAGPPHGR